MRMGIVLVTVKGRDLSERHLPRQRSAIMGLALPTNVGTRDALAIGIGQEQNQ
jgi:hypothetical protein